MLIIKEIILNVFITTLTIIKIYIVLIDLFKLVFKILTLHNVLMTYI